MPDSPTSRTLKALRAEGWRAAVVEKWNPHARIRQDLFGCIDVLGIKGRETLAVQACAASSAAARVDKVANSDALPEMRKAGWLVMVFAWRKNAQGRWVCRRIDVS